MAKAVAAAASTTTTACVAPPYSSKFDAHCGGVGVDVYVANLLETTWKNPSMICVVVGRRRHRARLLLTDNVNDSLIEKKLWLDNIWAGRRTS